jgi:hypothetical protein
MGGNNPEEIYYQKMEYKRVGRKPLKIQSLNTPRSHSHTKEEKKKKEENSLLL